MNKRSIITGAPGTGKTSLITALQKNGYRCYEEVSRKIIQAQQQTKGNKTPWGDLAGFATTVYLQTLKELENPTEGYSFVDRGLPDIIAYLQTRSYTVPKHLWEFPYKTYYHQTVFLTPPWEEIYTNDPQRPQSLQEAIQIHHQLLAVYQQLHFDIKIIPKTTLTKRVAFIQGII